MTTTPEFVIWAIEFTCPIRGFQDGSDPERTERQLRAARAVSDARAEGREFEGLAVDPPHGFRVEEALALAGGSRVVEQTCGPCLANALRDRQPSALAGCYGYVPLEDDGASFQAAIEQAAMATHLDERWPGLFPQTTPRWYGWWLQSPLNAERCAAVAAVLSHVVDTSPNELEALSDLRLGLQAAQQAGVRMHARVYPRGKIAGTQWQLARHCPQCHAEWPLPDKLPDKFAGKGTCAVCGHTGHPADEAKRKARGTRPYFPLDRLLGAEQAAAFLVRYAAFRTQPTPPDRPASLPVPMPPDSPPADSGF